MGEQLLGIVFMNSDWTDPRRLDAPVNIDPATLDGCAEVLGPGGNPKISGHQDSAYISPDGSRLWFAYTQPPFLREAACYRPGRPGQNGLLFDIYEAELVGGAWRVTNSPVNVERYRQERPNEPELGIGEASLGVSGDLKKMAFIRFDTDVIPEPDDPQDTVAVARAKNRGDIWLADNTTSPYDRSRGRSTSGPRASRTRWSPI